MYGRRFVRVFGWTAATALTACFPAITHGPRVDDGPTFGATVSRTGGPTYTEGDEGGIHLRQGHIGVHAGYGWASDAPNAPGFFVSAAVPLLFPAVQVDLFAQAPPAWTGPFSAGLGVNADWGREDVYAQVGRINDAGNGWFLMQGLDRRHPGGFYTSSLVSVTGASLQFTRRRLRTYVFAQYASGREPGACASFPSCTGPASSAFAVGITMAHVRARSPRSSPTPP